MKLCVFLQLNLQQHLKCLTFLQRRSRRLLVASKDR